MQILNDISKKKDKFNKRNEDNLFGFRYKANNNYNNPYKNDNYNNYGNNTLIISNIL